LIAASRHIDQFHFPLFHQMADRTVTTLHGRQDLPDLKPLYIGFSDVLLVSISSDQRRPIAKANFVATMQTRHSNELAHAYSQSPRRLCRVSRPNLAREAA
jgi:hypothetical protein